MQTDEKELKIQELRDELKNGRIRAGSTASQDSFGDNDSSIGEERPDTKTIHRPGIKNDAINGPAYDNQRGTDKKPTGIRFSTGRPRKNNSGAANTTAATSSGTKRAIGRIQAVDDVPEREESAEAEPEPPFISKQAITQQDYERIRGTDQYQRIGNTQEVISRSKWRRLPPSITQPGQQTAARPVIQPGERKNIFPWFKQGSTLSQAEAKLLEEPLIAALGDDFSYVDEYIWHRCKDEDQIPIWSDLDTEEIQTLARIMLKQGQRNPAAATMVRSLVEGSDYLATLVIVVPRVIKTVDRMKNAPKRVRPVRTRAGLVREQQA